MGSYRRPNMWLQLLHRPVSPLRIGIAVLGAGALLLTIASALPILVACAWQETMTARVVDIRHWMMPFASALLAACGYLAGVYCMLANKRYSLCALVSLVLLTNSHSSGWGALVFQALITLWLGVLAISAFKPDLNARPRGAVGMVATAVPLQLSVYLLLFSASLFGSELFRIVQGSNPNSSPLRGGHIEALKADARDALLAGLSASTAAEAPRWREQVALSEVFDLRQTLRELPARGDLTNPAPMEFDDAKRRVRWVFSHDSMRFHSHSLVDDQASIIRGIGTDDTPFDVPPQPLGTSSQDGNDLVLLGGGALYRYANEQQLLLPLAQLPRGELIVAAPYAVGARLAVLGNHALYFFDHRDDPDATSAILRLQTPLPGKIGNLSRITLIELIDGYLISFTFTAGARNGGVAPFQQLVRVHEDGRVENVAHRELRADYSAALRYIHWWLSPSLDQIYDGATNLFGAPAPLQEMDPPPTPRPILLLAGALMLASALVALWRTGQLAMSWPMRAAWIAACGLSGAPAAISLWLIHPTRARPDAAPAAAHLATAQ
jgi:hypothetical protein